MMLCTCIALQNFTVEIRPMVSDNYVVRRGQVADCGLRGSGTSPLCHRYIFFPLGTQSYSQTWEGLRILQRTHIIHRQYKSSHTYMLIWGKP